MKTALAYAVLSVVELAILSVGILLAVTYGRSLPIQPTGYQLGILVGTLLGTLVVAIIVGLTGVVIIGNLRR